MLTTYGQDGLKQNEYLTMKGALTASGKQVPLPTRPRMRAVYISPTSHGSPHPLHGEFISRPKGDIYLQQRSTNQNSWPPLNEVKV